jgi:hypothetical protein
MPPCKDHPMLRSPTRPLLLACALLADLMQAAPVAAQGSVPPLDPNWVRGGAGSNQTTLTLLATLGAATQHIGSGLRWRIYRERANDDGKHQLVTESTASSYTLALPEGTYVVHVAYGLASAMKRIQVSGQTATELLRINAGALRVHSILGETAIAPARVNLNVYVPDRSGADARLIVSNARPGDLLRLPEGNYRVVSTYLDKESTGSMPAPGAATNATNSVVSAELRVQTGRLTEATLRHNAATITLKLVNAAGAEALANTSFSVLTPGGDVIRELIGAFPSLILADGEYVVIARRSGKTYQKAFTVQSTMDRDEEIVVE